jgi:hypothetical protein
VTSNVSVSRSAIAAIVAEGHGWLKFAPGSGGQVTSSMVDAIRLAMEEANLAEQQRSHDDPEVGGSHVAVSPKAVLVYIDFCDSRAAIDAWTRNFALGLATVEEPIRIGRAKSEYLPGWGRDLPSVALGLTLPRDAGLLEADTKRYGQVPPGWHVAEERTLDLLNVLVPWCLTDAAECHLRSGSFVVRMDAGSVLSLITSAIPRVTPVTLATTSTDGAIRQFALCDAGHVAVQRHDPAGSTGPLADDLQELLVRCAPLVDYGLVKRGRIRTDTWQRVVNSEEPRMPSEPPLGVNLQGIRHLEDSHGTDAYAIQLLTQRHLAQQPDLSDWTVREVAPDRYLVSTSDVATWLADPDGPPAALLDAARRQFDPMLISSPMLGL